jgi:hypothetical protein
MLTSRALLTASTAALFLEATAGPVCAHESSQWLIGLAIGRRLR